MEDILAALARLQDWRNIVDVVLVSFIFYALLRLFRGTQAIQLMRGILLIALAVAIINQIAQLTALTWLLQNSAQVVLVAIPVIFQPEMRRALERLGRTTPIFMRRTVSANTQRLINEAVKSVEIMAQRRHGALMVFEGQTGLADIIAQGVQMNSHLSSELLTTIFFPNTALHDGAVIIRGDKIIAASCVLPLSQHDLIDGQMGTRHRAAIGVTEDSDAMAIVVSEETGSISVARNGRIVRRLETDRLRGIMSEFYKPY